MARPPRSKRDVCESLLQAGPTMLHLDPRHEGVDVPQEMAAGPVLRLNVSWNYANSLIIDDEGVSQRLTFPHGTFLCSVPWSAVFAVTPSSGGEPHLWVDALPPELKGVPGVLPQVAPAPVTAEEGDDVEKPGPNDPPGTIRRGHLKLVKG